MKSQILGAVVGASLLAGVGVGCGTAHEGGAASSKSATAETSATPATTSSSAPVHPVIFDCGGQAAQKPSVIVFFCADANELVKDISWSTWDANTSSGTGTLEHNTCTPYCAAGSWETIPVRLSVSKPEGDDHHFTAATVQFPDGHTEDFELPPPLPGH